MRVMFYLFALWSCCFKYVLKPWPFLEGLLHVLCNGHRVWQEFKDRSLPSQTWHWNTSPMKYAIYSLRQSMTAQFCNLVIFIFCISANAQTRDMTYFCDVTPCCSCNVSPVRYELDFISQKTPFFIGAAVGTSDLT
jgi:hypothetical protein